MISMADVCTKTVTKHVQNIFEKAGVSNKVELINKLEEQHKDLKLLFSKNAIKGNMLLHRPITNN